MSWRETKYVFDAACAAERDAADLLRREGFPDPLTRYREEADERTAAKEAETERRKREARRDQRQREDRTATIEAMAARITEVEGHIVNIASALDVMVKMFDKAVTRQELGELRAQLAHVEALLRTEPRERLGLPLVMRDVH